VIAEIELLAIDYSSASHTTTAAIRSVILDLDAISPNHPGLPTYDIVISIHQLGVNADLSVIHLSQLLVPGGFLVIVDEPPSSGDDFSDCTRGIPTLWEQRLTNAGLKIVSHYPGAKGGEYIFISQQSPLPPLSSLALTSVDTEDVKIFSFQISHAFSVQALLVAAASELNRATIWIESTANTCDGGAAIGFTRSLRQEIPATDIRLVLFDAKWSPEARNSIIRQLSNHVSRLEPEIMVDICGTLLVPRLLPTASPHQTFDPSAYWRLEGKNVLQPALPIPGPRRVLVKINCVSKTEGQLQSVVGRVVRTASSKLTTGTRVVGVISPVLSNFAVIYEGQLAAISPYHSDEEACDIALPLLFAALAIELETESSPEENRFLVIQTGDIAEKIKCVLLFLGLNVVMIAPSTPQRFPPLLPGDVVLFGSSPASLRGINLAQTGVHLFNWNEDALNVLNNNPRLVGESIRTHLSGLLPPLPLVSSSSYIPEHVIPADFEHSPSVTFSHDKFYLVIGGLGSLGLQISIWLYKVALSRHTVYLTI
jgi:hypothetical protein